MSMTSAVKQTGRVIGAGLMKRTVKVEVVQQTWHKYLRKHFQTPAKIFVHDPNDSVKEGDIIAIVPEQHSKRVQHVVHSVITPFGTPLSERPPIMTELQREQKNLATRRAKLERRASRGIESAIVQLGKMGIEPPAIQPLAEKAIVRSAPQTRNGARPLSEGTSRSSKIEGATKSADTKPSRRQIRERDRAKS